MKKIVAFVLIGSILCGALAGCGTSGRPASSEAPVFAAEVNKAEDVSAEKYAFITAASNLEYYSAHKKGMIDACAALGVTPLIVGDEKVDAGTMSNLIEATIERGVSGIVLIGHFPDAYAPIVDKAWGKGIPVIMQETDADSKRLCYIGTDYYTFGQKQMDLVAEAIGGKGKIAISTSMDSGQAAIDQLNGAKDRAAEKYPEIEIAAVLEDKAQTDTAVSVISACLQANKDLNAILGQQSISGVAAVTACREAGRLEDIKIIAVDRDTPTLEGIEAGEIYASMAGKQYAETYYAATLLYDFNHTPMKLSSDDKAAGLIGIPSYVDVGTIAITKENVQYFKNVDYSYNL